ncbi:SymE family type I addiction module toxin [Pinibacter aurantiacus]|uniref:Type I toxin-antitoxin system SymE family toxin n=1 Tax=Pinibacter aurantiacus TaxID=2851599 RepID=A0A9E2W788_9BACT|nr:SymE family type I addiction module toxin [Pinibacter aurantiacus]MBV4355817.1 type I toxin-antitoxin system SymE family toxin [Pinibacter aurantiacus]
MTNAAKKKSPKPKAIDKPVRYFTLTSYLQPSSYRRYTEVPMLRLMGKWLEHAGFPPEKRISITIEKGKLTMQPVNDN